MTTPTTVQVRFQFRADTAANWTSINPVLLANELGREQDTGKIKIGNGSDAWSSLPYQALGRISNSDIAADAEIAVSKLANGTANQILTTDGADVSWTDSPTIAGNVIIEGNLTVNGTETIINVETLQVEDHQIEIGNVTTPSDLTADGGGIVLKGSSNKTILWVDSTDSWTSSENVDLASGKTYKIAGTDVLSATTLGSAVVNSSLTSVGNLTDLTVDTDTLVVDATNDRVGVNTATPANTLDVTSTNSTISSTSTGNSTGKIALNADRAASTVNGQILGQWNGNTVSRIDFINGADDVNKDDGSISFLTSNNSSNPLTRMSIAQSGDVAIDTDTLYVDATNNRVGAGTASPDATLHALIGTSGKSWTPPTGTSALFERNSINYVTIAAANNNTSQLNFADTDDADIGNIKYSHANDSLTFGVNNSDRLVIDSSGRLLVGTPSASTDTRLVLQGTSSNSNAGAYIHLQRGNLPTGAGSPTGRINFADNSSNIGAWIDSASDGAWTSGSSHPGRLVFSTTANGATTPTERMRIDSSGRLLVGATTGTTEVAAKFQARAGTAAAQGTIMLNRGAANPTNGVPFGDILFADLNEAQGAKISAVSEGTWAANDYPSRLAFFTTASGDSSPTERMRIASNGNVYIGKANITISADGHAFIPDGQFRTSITDNNNIWINRNGSDGSVIVFRKSNTTVGTITVTASATAYNTTSDYRLKENVVPLTGAADRLNQLQVRRFNFIADPDKTVDGFIAHEAQAVVPEAVTGTHNEVDDDGNPVYQGIDQSKLVPLLTAALQEAVAKIEVLEAKVAALEGN